MAFPSSGLIFAGLVVAWLVVLVPMVSRSRQEIARNTESALTARVLSRGGVRGSAQEMDTMSDEAEDFPEVETAYRSIVDSESAARRPYRPGRGGFDPEIAAMAARAKYAFRQRVVIGLLLAALVTAFLASLRFPTLWWAHLVIDLVLVGYLVYLRRQVQIEKELRERRTARYMNASSSFSVEAESDMSADSLVQPLSEPTAAQLRAAVVELDDEDPVFHELIDDSASTSYRQAGDE